MLCLLCINSHCSSSVLHFRRSLKSSSQSYWGRLLNTLRVMTQITQELFMRPWAMQLDCLSAPLAWRWCITSTFTMCRGWAWRSEWPCVTWFIRRWAGVHDLDKGKTLSFLVVTELYLDCMRGLLKAVPAFLCLYHLAKFCHVIL